MKRRRFVGTCSFGWLAILWTLGVAEGQDRLKTMPGYARFQEKSKEIPGSFKSGALTVTWHDDGKAFEYRKDGKSYRFDIASKKAEEVKPGQAEAPSRGGRAGRGGGPGRGQQANSCSRPTVPSAPFIATVTST